MTGDLLQISRAISTATEKLGTAQWVLGKVGEEYPVRQATFHYTEADVVDFLDSASAVINCALADARRARDAKDSISSRIARGEMAKPTGDGAVQHE
jgi:hypothetical protein